VTTVYLNGSYLPIEEARISPMDRGFLFGDGIYEVIPCHGGRGVGLGLHLARLRAGLDAIDLAYPVDDDEWGEIVDRLVQADGGEHLGIYIQISRGADQRRAHAMPRGIEATRFAYAFDIPAPQQPDKASATRFSVATSRDRRWQRCHIKSTSLLGNVMHYEEGRRDGAQEVLLFNAEDQLTEAAACNVFVVSGGEIATPELDHQKLPGITRHMLLDMLRRHSARKVTERPIHRSEVEAADELWLTSSSKEVAPIVSLDGRPVGDGEVGDVWLEAQTLFDRHRFDY
jgi:D-alanine transaminase